MCANRPLFAVPLIPALLLGGCQKEEEEGEVLFIDEIDSMVACMYDAVHGVLLASELTDSFQQSDTLRMARGQAARRS